MRTLTDSEARVVGLLLANAPASEREALKRTGLPRSTYHSIRRRAYAEGWLRDRYIPNPAVFGFPFATFRLSRPFAERAAGEAARWSADPGNVLLWNGRQWLFGVSFRREADGRPATESETDPKGTGGFEMTADLRGPSVPVYFDYEGLWSHLAGSAGTLSYPHGLGGAPAPAATPNGDAGAARHRWAAGRLVERPFSEATDGRAPHLMGPFGLASSFRWVLEQGWVAHRVLPNAASLPAYRGRSAGLFVFVTGRLRSGVGPSALFATLTRDCQVFPFLFATDQERVLFGALGAPESPTDGPTPPGPARPRAVMAALRESLEEIEIVSESSSELRVIVDHRYDRLFASPAAGPDEGSRDSPGGARTS
jgi:hypothetical protein